MSKTLVFLYFILTILVNVYKYIYNKGVEKTLKNYKKKKRK